MIEYWIGLFAWLGYDLTLIFVFRAEQMFGWSVSSSAYIMSNAPGVFRSSSSVAEIHDLKYEVSFKHT